MHIRRSLTLAGLAATLSLATVLVGCTAAPPSPDTTSMSPTATSTPAPSASAPTLLPDGSADDNLPLFTAVMNAVWDAEDPVRGRAYVDALVEAGFDKSAMEVTKDETTVGNPAESIQFSVLWGDECLIGQVGPSTPAPTAVVVSELPSGGCLVGQTRPIDW